MKKRNAKVLQDKLSSFIKKEESLENLYNYLKNNDKETNPKELEKILKELSKEYEWLTIGVTGQFIEKQGTRKFIENLTKIRLEEMINIKNDLIAFLNGRFISLYDALSWHIKDLDKEFEKYFGDEGDEQ